MTNIKKLHLTVVFSFLILMGGVCRGPEPISQKPVHLEDPDFIQFKLAKAWGGSREQLMEDLGGELPPDQEIIEHESEAVNTYNGEKVRIKTFYAVKKEPDLNGADLADVIVTKCPKDYQCPPDQQYLLTFVFKIDADGSSKIARLTRENIGDQILIIIGGEVITAPVIRSEIKDKAEINGISNEEVKKICAKIGCTIPK